MIKKCPIELFKILKDQRSEIDKKITRVAKKAITKSFKKLFADNPDLEEVAWTQYTPYFNDGDTTYFSANTDEPYVNGENYCSLASGNKKRFDELQNQTRDLLALYYTELEEMFGDHMKITVTNKGVETTSYDRHD